MARGLAYAGCSAGISCLGELTGDSAATPRSERILRPGLRAFPGTHLGPHWDVIDRFAPGLKAFIISRVGPKERLVGVDNDTGLVGDGRDWRVMGSGSVHVLEEGRWTDHPAGTSFALALAG
jgi:cyanophycinase-like exopeptidase